MCRTRNEERRKEQEEKNCHIERLTDNEMEKESGIGIGMGIEIE